MVHKYR